MPDLYRKLCFFPALPLSKNVQLGDWIVGAPPDDTKWATIRFKELSELALSAFDRLGFRRPSLMWHSKNGFDGEMPQLEECGAIQSSVRFAALDYNDATDGDPNRAYDLVTSENAELFIQPLDEVKGTIAYRRGGALKGELGAGYKIGEQAIPLPDATLPIQTPIVMSRTLAQAVHSHLQAQSGKASSIRTALEWHGVAMANPHAVTVQQRLIALKTGFEAILGTSDSLEGSQLLRKLFADATSQHLKLLPWAGILWSPKELRNLKRVRHTRGGKAKIDTRSELEDWFMTLSEVRNAIIHEGIVKAVEYSAPPERPLSRYAGPLLWVGERLLREAIKASLGPDILLCGAISEQKSKNEVIRKFKAMLTQDSEDKSEAKSSSTETRHSSADVTAADKTRLPEPPRTLVALLAQLGSAAGNEVQVERLPGGAWGARAGHQEMLISEAECDVLRAAGAEDKLNPYVRLCD